MKKSTIITIICFVIGTLVLACLFIACTDNNISNKFFSTTTTTTTTTSGQGSTDDPVTYEPMDFLSEDMTKYVTLGQYKGIEIKVDSLTASESDIDLELHVLLCQNEEYTKVRSGKVTERTIFNFDYTGYLLNEDGSLGSKFDGGSSTNQLAYIDGTNFITVSADGTGSFIDGFAQGIIGATVGTTFNIDVTFPANYGASDLAGKKVVFEIKLNFIAKTEPTDEAINYITSGTYKTVKEIRQYFKETIESNIKSHAEEQIWNTIMANATFIEIPQQQFDYMYNMFVEEVEYYVAMYAMYGMTYTFDQMLQMFGFANTEALKEYTKDYVKNDVIYYAIMQAENIQVTDEEYRAFLDTIIEQTGKTEEEILATYTEEYIKEQIMYDKTYDLVMTENKVVVK